MKAKIKKLSSKKLSRSQINELAEGKATLFQKSNGKEFRVIFIPLGSEYLLYDMEDFQVVGQYVDFKDLLQVVESQYEF